MSISSTYHKTNLVEAAHSQPSAIHFRDALKMAGPDCAAALDMSARSFDEQLAKVLIDFKFGRFQQSQKRFHSLCHESGFNMHALLVTQKAAFTEEQAPLLILELLFFLRDNSNPPPEEIWRYFDTVAWFHPDDTICHGAIYNLLMVFCMRQGNLSSAEELAKLALDAFAQCDSPYLKGYIHLHQAYISIFASQLDNAERYLEQARHSFDQATGTDYEHAIVAITRLWVAAEHRNSLPKLEALFSLKEVLLQGGFWPETFLTYAALQFRASMDQEPSRVLEHHAALEAILRIRGMTQLLPAMQLMREEYFGASRAEKGQKNDPLKLSERHLALLLPTLNTLRLNWGGEAGSVSLTLPRLQALQGLFKTEQALAKGRFDLAASDAFFALELIEKHHLFYLLSTETQLIHRFFSECRRRRRFVEQVRRYQNTVMADLSTAMPPTGRPSELTASEYGVLKRLAHATSNKAMARDLDVTEATIKFHLKNIYRKLKVNSRRAAIEEAADRGWIDPVA